MIGRVGRFWLTPLCSVAALLCACGQVSAQAKKGGEVERILADWQKRQDRIKRVKYSISGEWISPKGCWTGMPQSKPGIDPPADIVQPQHYDIIVDMERGRYRQETREQIFWQATQRLEPVSHILTFNGKDAWSAGPREMNPPRQELDPDFEIRRGAKSKSMLLRLKADCGLPLVFACGLLWVGREGADFGQRLDPDDFRVHGRAIHDGRKCVVLRTFPLTSAAFKPFDEYWVDTDRDSAIIRFVYYMDTGHNPKIQYDIDISYQQTAHGWLPLRWKEQIFGGQTGLHGVFRRRVDAIDVDPPIDDSTFQLQPEPGMIVAEYNVDTDRNGNTSHSGEKRFRVNEDGRFIPLGTGLGPPAGGWSMAPYGFVLIGIVAVCLLMWFFYRRRRGSAQAGASAEREKG